MKDHKYDVQCSNDDILEMLSLKNRYKFLNNNFISVLKPEQFNFLKKIEKFFIRFEEKNNITHKEDFYEWIPKLGKEGLVTRAFNFEELGLNYQDYGMMAELIRIFGTDFFDPQLAMGMGASVLCVNHLYFHNEGVDIRLRALKEIVTGEKIACICIKNDEI